MSLSLSAVSSPVPLRRAASYGGGGGSGGASSPLSLSHHYHMSRQNPAVLDKLYSIDQPSPSQEELLYKTHSPGVNRAASSTLTARHLSGHSPHVGLQSSLVKQTLSHRSSLPSAAAAGSSIVQLAARRTHHSISPVVVRLAGPDSALEPHRYSTSPRGERAADPCSKDAVVLALKQKRYCAEIE